MSSKHRVVVVGGVACGLPFYISGEVYSHNQLMATPTGVVRDTHFFKAVKGIEVKNHTLVKCVDRKKKIVNAIQVETGETVSFPYDSLILFIDPDHGFAVVHTDLDTVR